MFAEYKRDVSHNYLILHGDETINTTSYQVRILTGNIMSSILKCRMQGLDGTWLFYYDITSKQSLASFYEQRKLQGEDLEMILKGFLHVIEEMAEFLLNTEQLVLCPEYIFLDVEKKEVSFCCLPDYHHPVQEQFRELTEYLLPKLDHEDPTAVNLGYGIYRKAMEPGMQLENIKELLYRSENSKEKIAESDTKIRDKEEYVEEMEEPPQFFQEEKKEKKDRKWQPAAGCAVGVLFLLGILIFRYLGYFPEIPIEIVLGAAILLMGVGAGWTWMEEKKKKKQEQSAEWRNKVQRELAGMNIEKHETERNNTERKEIKDIEQKSEKQNRTEQNSWECEKTGEDTAEQETYGETVVLSAGQLSGTASLVSREPGELPTVYLERELTVIGKLEQASDVVISLPTVSRVHARIRKTGENYYLADLNSRNGTSVNGRLLGAEEEYFLQDEDQVDFAQARYVFLKG